MYLENYVCNNCGRRHEICICIDAEEEFYYYIEYVQSQYDNSQKENNTYPKFKEEGVEVSEGIIVSKEVYNKYYK